MTERLLLVIGGLLWFLQCSAVAQMACWFISLFGRDDPKPGAYMAVLCVWFAGLCGLAWVITGQGLLLDWYTPWFVGVYWLAGRLMR